MLYKNIIISIIMGFIGINVFSQDMYLPKLMYVNSIESLQIYSEPSMTSNEIGTYIHGEQIYVFERDNRLVIINGIRSYWYQVRPGFINGKWYNKGWVFGGYLSEQLPENLPVIIGSWDVENEDNYIFKFEADGYYIEGINRIREILLGKWSLDGNNLHIINEQKNILINIVIINRNEIILNYPDGNIKKLIRRINRY